MSQTDMLTFRAIAKDVIVVAVMGVSILATFG